MLNKTKQAIRNVLDKIDGSHEDSLLELFTHQDSPSVYISSTCNMDELLTKLNKLKPFSLNRSFYLRHMVSKVYESIDLDNLEKLIRGSMYSGTEFVYVKDINLNSLRKRQYTRKLSDISNELYVTIIIESDNGLVVETKYEECEGVR